MRTLIKSFFAIMAVGLFSLSLPVGAADSAKDKNKNEPLEKCSSVRLKIKQNHLVAWLRRNGSRGVWLQGA